MESKGRKIHKQALETQEKGDFTRALELEERAMVAYQEAGDFLGLSEIQAMRFLTLRHLYKKTGNGVYLTLAKHAIESAIEIVQDSGIKEALAIPFFNLAKLQQEMGDLKAAVSSYRLAVKNILQNPDSTHDRQTVKLDFQIHLALAEYKAGDKKALKKAEQLTEELEKTTEKPDYERNVWLTKAHMNLAEVLKEDNPQRSKWHLDKAKEMIDADKRLKLVGQQWQELAKKLLQKASL